MKVFKLLMITIILLGSQLTTAGEMSGLGTITGINMPASGEMIRINFSLPFKNPSNCTGSDMYIKEITNDASNRFVSTVLAAYMAKKQVEFWIDGCTTKTWWGKTQPQIYDIYIHD